MKGNFESIINDPRPVIVDFHALWCGPCRVQSPVLKELASEIGHRARIIKIDVDRNPEIARRYNIQGVPTLALFKKGELKYKQPGVHSKSQIIDLINSKT